MTITPIQVVENTVLIPRLYFGDAQAFEVIVQDETILIRPKSSSTNGRSEDTIAQFKNEPISQERYAALKTRFPWIGAAKELPPDLSEHTEDILAAEVDSQSGWTTKESLTD